jgi:hypothetical protein
VEETGVERARNSSAGRKLGRKHAREEVGVALHTSGAAVGGASTGPTVHWCRV